MNRKKISASVLALFCAAALSAIEIEDALHQTAEQFSSSIKSGTTIAIIGISSETRELSDFMLDELTLGFVQAKKLTIANRANLEAIKTEMNFQLSGEVSDESIQQLGAKVVVHGSLKTLGRNFNLVVQALDVTTAAVVDMCRFSVEPNDTTRVLLSGTPNTVSKPSKKNTSAKSSKSVEKKSKAHSKSAKPTKPLKNAEETPPAPVSVPTRAKTPVTIPSGSDDYHIVDLSDTPAKDVRDNFTVYNRGEIPIQVAVYYVGANNKWVYAGGTMVKKQSSKSISELGGIKERPPLYGIRVADASGGTTKFLVSWDTGNHDLRVYVQPSFF